MTPADPRMFDLGANNEMNDAPSPAPMPPSLIPPPPTPLTLSPPSPTNLVIDESQFEDFEEVMQEEHLRLQGLAVDIDDSGAIGFNSANRLHNMSNTENIPITSNMPNTANTPFMSNMPNAANMPLMSNMPNTANMHLMSNMPLTSNMPDTANMPLMSNMPDTANMPLMSNMPNTANMPLMSNMPNTANMPLMSNMPNTANMHLMSNMPLTSNMPDTANMPLMSNMPITADIPYGDRRYAMSTLPPNMQVDPRVAPTPFPTYTPLPTYPAVPHAGLGYNLGLPPALIRQPPRMVSDYVNDCTAESYQFQHYSAYETEERFRHVNPFPVQAPSPYFGSYNLMDTDMRDENFNQCSNTFGNYDHLLHVPGTPSNATWHQPVTQPEITNRPVAAVGANYFLSIGDECDTYNSPSNETIHTRITATATATSTEAVMAPIGLLTSTSSSAGQQTGHTDLAGVQTIHSGSVVQQSQRKLNKNITSRRKGKPRKLIPIAQLWDYMESSSLDENTSVDRSETSQKRSHSDDDNDDSYGLKYRCYQSRLPKPSSARQKPSTSCADSSHRYNTSDQKQAGINDENKDPQDKNVSTVSFDSEMTTSEDTHSDDERH